MNTLPQTENFPGGGLIHKGLSYFPILHGPLCESVFHGPI